MELKPGAGLAKLSQNPIDGELTIQQSWRQFVWRLLVEWGGKAGHIQESARRCWCTLYLFSQLPGTAGQHSV